MLVKMNSIWGSRLVDSVPNKQSVNFKMHSEPLCTAVCHNNVLCIGPSIREAHRRLLHELWILIFGSTTSLCFHFTPAFYTWNEWDTIKQVPSWGVNNEYVLYGVAFVLISYWEIRKCLSLLCKSMLRYRYQKI